MKHRFICALTIILIIIILGLHQLGVVFFEYKGKEEGTFLVEILSEAEEKDYYNVYNGKIDNKKFLIYIPKNIEKFNFKDKLKVDAKYVKPEGVRNKGGFDYSLYLKTKKVYGTFKVQRVLEVKKNKSFHLYNSVQNYIKATFRKNLSKDNSNLAIGLLLGDKTGIEEDVKKSFKTANLMHMLAISGAHFSYVIMILSFLGKRLKNKRIENIILIVGIIFFMNLTGNTPSVVRAGIMSIMQILASLFKRKNDFYTSLSLSILIQILFNPYVIFDLGFILSYSGVIGIVSFYKFFEKKIKFKVISVTLAANVLISPIMMYNFNTISFTFVISNVLASGLLGVVIIMELICAVVPVKGLFIILDISLSILTKIAKFSASIPFSKVYVTNDMIFVVLILYLIVYLIIKKKKKSLPLIICIVIIFSLVFNVYNFFKVGNDELKINFIDVGQGDSTLLINSGKTLLIDTGGSFDYDIGEKILHRYLLYKGISKLDYMMISHFDADHCQGAIFLLENMKVKNLIISKQPEESNLYNEIIKIANKKKVNVIYVKKGDAFSIGKLNIKIINPGDNFINENVLNNNAIVCKITYYNFKMLFTGDIEKIAEQSLLEEDLSADLLKVGHHGSKTSSSEEFLSKVNPKIALIGVGKNNKFGHPNEGVIDRLNKRNAKIYRTDLFGEINIRVKKSGKIKINTLLKN